ncbi:MAG: hypothetical protein B6D45_02565 [Ignavibacteriales bacterium UTCHB3]|nr:MAG: hypothetical protein B6D45_02565 [Ignavibacteriales bacterium UTCHB3]
MNKVKLANWGRYPVIETSISSFNEERHDVQKIRNAHGVIARGLGRCYGDSSLAENILSTLNYNKFIAFDETNGVLRCEAGVSFADILEVFVPKGWFLPVTPGTKFITVGGAVASDVHGKNHHKEGTFGNWVHSLKILIASGEVINCSPGENADLFFATVGGMGLTGIILEVVFSLKKIETAFITQQVHIAKNLDEVMRLFDENKAATYSVAWIDCLAGGKTLGRSVLYLGEHSKTDEIADTIFADKPLYYHGKGSIGVPFNFPSGSLNSLSIRLFNSLYYGMNKLKSDGKIHINPFFYPLDSVNNWNRIYGKKGFLQYQFVLPLENSREGMTEILTALHNEGRGSFLAVLKLFGKQIPYFLPDTSVNEVTVTAEETANRNETTVSNNAQFERIEAESNTQERASRDGKNQQCMQNGINHPLISFPMEGYTLALDFPITSGLMKFLNKLDEIVLEHNGRFYFTKDSRLKPDVFRKGYPELDQFLKIKRKYDPENTFSSSQSKRLGLT